MMSFNRITIALGTLLLALVFIVFALQPELAALFAQLLFLVPAFTGLVIIATSAVWELIQTGTVDFKSRDLGFERQRQSKEVQLGDDEPEGQSE